MRTWLLLFRSSLSESRARLSPKSISTNVRSAPTLSRCGTILVFRTLTVDYYNLGGTCADIKLTQYTKVTFASKCSQKQVIIEIILR